MSESSMSPELQEAQESQEVVVTEIVDEADSLRQRVKKLEGDIEKYKDAVRKLAIQNSDFTAANMAAAKIVEYWKERALASFEVRLAEDGEETPTNHIIQ